jgi:hypothetical protein
LDYGTADSHLADLRVLTFDGANREESNIVSMGQKGAISTVWAFFGKKRDE